MANEETEISRDQLKAEADALAREVLGVSADEAWRRVRDEHLYEGTFFAGRLAEIYFLLGEPDSHYPAAAE